MTSKRCKLTAGGKDEGLGQKMDPKKIGTTLFHQSDMTRFKSSADRASGTFAIPD